ncbi:Mediator complex, subunit Med10 [Phytophthora cactorum]|nr:Mediator complex, subunit Med10 [Phytophthora cactorum]
MDAPKTLEEEDVDTEPDQFLADLPPQAAPKDWAPLRRPPVCSPRRPRLYPPPRSRRSVALRSGPQQSKHQAADRAHGTRNRRRGLRSGTSATRDDVVKHLPPKLLETLVDVVRTLDQLADGVADFRPDQLGFLSDKAQRYVELLQQADRAASEYSADIPLQVLRMMEEGSNPELFTKNQLDKCEEESGQAAAKVETLEMLKGALQAGLDELK